MYIRDVLKIHVFKNSDEQMRTIRTIVQLRNAEQILISGTEREVITIRYAIESLYSKLFRMSFALLAVDSDVLRH